MLPIGPGTANVAPLNEEAFKLATLVVEVTVNGAVPVATVEVILVPVIDPDTCNLSVALSVAVPRSILPPYCANLITPVSNTSIDGIPDTSFTENIEPDKLLVIENN